MRICRFDTNRVGVVEGQTVLDITESLDLSPCVWPFSRHDIVIEQLMTAGTRGIEAMLAHSRRLALTDVRLMAPVANPSKIIGAPINYRAHIDEANADSEINHGKTFTSLEKFGLFLKANTCLIGPSDEVQLTFPSRRSDHEVELAVVIGRAGRFIKEEDALTHVFGYSVSLDMTTRGPEFPGFRKSIDTYGVLGPWLVTSDEIADPNSLEIDITVNGVTKQASNTRHLIFNVQRLIEYASRFYTLLPGDVIMTGTPEGVSPVVPGDALVATIEKVGTLEVGMGSTWLDE